jgi:AcrR family transcriptional regulator
MEDYANRADAMTCAVEPSEEALKKARLEFFDRVSAHGMEGALDQALRCAYAIDRPAPVVDREAVFREVLTVVDAHSGESRECRQADADKATDAICALATTRDEVERDVEWRWKHLIAGGEDAPGSAVMLSFDEAERIIKEDRTRADAAEAERDAMRAVVEAAEIWSQRRGRDAGLYEIAKRELERAVAALATNEG